MSFSFSSPQFFTLEAQCGPRPSLPPSGVLPTAAMDSDNQFLYLKSPWGLPTKLPLMNLCLPRHHYCHSKDGDNYLVYYPEAGFIRPMITGNKRLISVFRSPEEMGKRFTFLKLLKDISERQGWSLQGWRYFQPNPFQNTSLKIKKC